MSLLKDVSIESIRRMLENITTEDIIYGIRFIGHVLEGLKDVKQRATRLVKSLICDVIRLKGGEKS